MTEETSPELEQAKAQFSNSTHEKTAEAAAQFLFAMAYYHDRMKLHIMLHPLFYMAGFLTAYYLIGGK
jgi:hypothetical protein